MSSLRVLSYALLGIVCGSLISGAALNIGISFTNISQPGDEVFGSLSTFKSASELRAFLSTHSTRPNYYFEGGFLGFPFMMLKSQVDTTSSAVTAPDYSVTNVQVEGVDEADLVKTDGKYLYIGRGQTVYILLAYPAQDAALLSKIEINEQVGDIFVAEDKLIVFSQAYQVYSIIPSPKIMPPYPRTDTTNVRVYDISDRTSVKIEREFKAEGGYLSSRMIGEYVYLIVQKGAWIFDERLQLPTIMEGSASREIQPNEIYYYNGTDPWYAYTMVLGFNTQDPTSPLNSETFLLGSGSAVYVSLENLYVTTGRYMNTGIHKIKLNEGKAIHIAEGSVPGWVLNQFSMDEYEGFFRIATTSGSVSRGGSSSSNNVYVLDKEMKIVGKLEDLAPGESIYSARFMGNRCYLVTFKKVDPLFVIDLSDSQNPRVLGKLKIPGYSNYLHPYDETHVIGFGKETVEAENGDFAWYQGIKISLFDVSDVSNPIELSKIEIGDRGTDSPALYDHRAFLFNRERNLLVIPILEAKINPSLYAGKPPADAYGDFVYQGAYIFKIDLEDINLRGKVTHLSGEELIKSGYWFDSEYSIERSLYIGQNLYTISSRLVKINNLGDLAELAKIELK